MKKVAVLFLFAVVVIGGYAQDVSLKYRKSQLAVGIRGGISNLLVVPVTTTNIGPMFGIEADYAYFFNQTVGLSLGVGASYMGSTLKAEDVYSYPMLPLEVRDANGIRSIASTYTCHTPDITEHIKTINIEVPLMFLLQGNPLDIDIRHFHKCYFGIGAKVVLPLKFSSESDISASSVALGRDVEGSGVTLNETMPLYSLDPQHLDYDVREVLSPLYIMAALEAGATFTFNSGSTLLFGLYFDYALNHSVAANDATAYTIAASGATLSPTGYLASCNTDWFKFFRVGAKLQYVFGF
ncbi:MAG: hypothetical protein KBT04_04345 [Bacteroidales bacterium]|nr:hypothetical protein [Candidatus Colimorpha onthohippi]